MISFDDLVGGLVGGKEKMSDVSKSSAKEKIMQHLDAAKQLADESGVDFMEMASECCEPGDKKDMGDMMAKEEEPEEMEESESEDSEYSEEEDMPSSEEGKKARMSAIIMKIKGKKE